MKRFLILFLSAAAVTQGFSQTAPASAPAPAAPDKPLKFSLNADGSHYFQATFLNQTWVRFNQSNPGTLVQGNPTSQTMDIGLRRTRIQLFGQVTDHAFIYFQFGQNNFNFLNNAGTMNSSGVLAGNGNRKFSAFFHDALGEYKVFKTNDNLRIGGGLTIANGLSRFSQPSIGTILTLDVPVFAQATVDQTDEFSRKLSVYARGQIGKLEYRAVLSDPFPITSNGQTAPAISANSSFAQRGHRHQYQGMLTWQFFDHEPMTTPYMTGTFLGKKKVLNVSAGAIYQPDAMWHLTGTDTTYQPMLLWCAEAFLDMPLNKDKGTAVSAYAGYFNYNFGSNYLRYNGIMNPANGNTAGDIVTGAGNTFGNAYPMMGTGSSEYVQAGYLFPKALLGEDRGQLQGFASVHHADWDRLDGHSTDVIDLGANWLIDGHKAKLSLDYQNRPTFTQTAGEIASGPRKSCVIMQYQLFI